MKADLAYAALAATAIGGIASPLLFAAQFPAVLKTFSLCSGIAASATLAYIHESGSLARAREWNATQRASRHRLREEALISHELRETKRLEFEDLKEVLIMLDELTPVEQRYYLNQLGLPELFELYQPPMIEPIREPEPEPIEVKAKEVKEPEFAGTLNWSVQNVIEQALRPQQPSGAIIDDTFEEVDLGKAIAEMMISGQVPQCVMLACPPRTGKTTLLTVTIAWLHRLTEGGAKIKICNGKENIDPETGELVDKFLGLVDDPTRYEAIETNEAGKKFAEEFHEVAQNMRQPRKHPEVLILDEYNNIRARVAGYDKENGLPKAKGKLNQMDADAELLVTQGTSRRQFLLMTSHSAYVKNVGIDRSYQDGIYSIVLGRGGALDGLYKSLKGATAVVQNTVRANQLLIELQQWEQSPVRDHDKVVALTNLVTGNFGLYFVKYIDLSKVGFAPITEPPQPESEAEDPYAVWDEQYEDEFGNQPEAEMPKPSEPNAVNLSQEQLTQILLNWIQSFGRIPSDAELAAKVEEVVKVAPSEDVLAGIKWLLSKHGIQFNPGT